MSQALAATVAAEATPSPPSSTSPPSGAGQATSSSKQPITLILPTSGKLFFEKKSDLQLCKPQLLPLKSFSLEKLEKMHQEAQRQLQETRTRTAAGNAKEVF